MPQFYNWARYTKVVFYKLGTPGAVTQTAEFLSNFTNGAPLGSLPKLPNFYQILQMGHPWGRYTNCRIFTNGAPLGPLRKQSNFYHILETGHP